MQRHQHPLPAHPHLDGVGHGDQQAPGARSQPGDMMQQQPARMDSRGWAARSDVAAGAGRHAPFTEMRPELDNVQVVD